MTREEFETQKFPSVEHKRIHPFDVYVMLLDAKVTDVIKRGREKVTVEAEGHAPYSYWASVVEIDGVLYTDTATVEPQTDKGKDMLRESTRYGKMPTKMPKTTITYSHLEVQPPALCGFAMSKSRAGVEWEPGSGAIYCNREKGHSGNHSHTFPMVVNAVRDQYKDRINFSDLAASADQVERLPRWAIIAILIIAGMVFGAAVAALVLLTPTQ